MPGTIVVTTDQSDGHVSVPFGDTPVVISITVTPATAPVEPPPVQPPPTPDPMTLQARIDAWQAGTVLDLTGLSYTAGATIAKPLTLVGATIDVPSGVGLKLTSGDVTLRGNTIRGPLPTAASYVNGQRGIDVSATAAKPLAGIVIDGNTITGFGGFAVRLQNVTAPTVTGNTIEDIGYAGVMLLSAKGGTVKGNTVRRIGVHTNVSGEYNAYGIVATRQSGSEPVCTDVVVEANDVSDVPNWHGLDTHAGLRIKWLGNHVSRCNRAVFLTGDSYGANTAGNVFSGNTCDEPTRRADVLTTYPYNQVGLTIVAGATGTTGDGNRFDGWPNGNHVTGLGGSNVLTGTKVTGSY